MSLFRYVFLSLCISVGRFLYFLTFRVRSLCVYVLRYVVSSFCMNVFMSPLVRSFFLSFVLSLCSSLFVIVLFMYLYRSFFM